MGWAYDTPSCLFVLCWMNGFSHYYDSFLNNELTAQLINDIINAPQNADQNPKTKNPLTTEDANQNIKAFITKVKIPRVTMLMGRVRRIRNGRMRAFTKPNTKAATKAE